MNQKAFDNSCKVCMANQINTVLLNCGHRVICEQCKTSQHTGHKVEPIATALARTVQEIRTSLRRLTENDKVSFSLTPLKASLIKLLLFGFSCNRIKIIRLKNTGYGNQVRNEKATFKKLWLNHACQKCHYPR